MNVSLTPRLERLVQRKVASGLYHSASEVVRAGLRLLEDEEELKRTRLERLKADLAVGLAEADRGESKPLDMAAIRAQLRAKTRKKA